VASRSKATDAAWTTAARTIRPVGLVALAMDTPQLAAHGRSPVIVRAAGRRRQVGASWRPGTGDQSRGSRGRDLRRATRDRVGRHCQLNEPQWFDRRGSADDRPEKGRATIRSSCTELGRPNSPAGRRVPPTTAACLLDSGADRRSPNERFAGHRRHTLLSTTTLAVPQARRSSRYSARTARTPCRAPPPPP
jgi:hypothetical protein